MKSKILVLIIGILIGAIITASGFLIYYKVVLKNPREQGRMQMDENGQMQPPLNRNMEEPPSLPNKNDGNSPEKPSNLNTNNNI